MSSFEVAEAGIAELRLALEAGRVTSVGLVEAYLRRIEAYDRGGPMLNSIVVDNPEAMAEAAASDQRRSDGESARPTGRHPVHRQGQLSGDRPDGGSGITRLRRPDRPPGRLRHRAVAPRRRDPDRADEYAADGQRRHAARPLRARRKSLQRRVSDLRLRLRFLQRLRNRHRRQLRGVRARGGDVVQWARAGHQQRSVRLHALARGDLGARQLAAGADHGCGRAAHPHHGRHVRGARRRRR